MARRQNLWSFGNFYAFLFGWPVLARAHQLLLDLSLHALGYDNAKSMHHSGEAWFIKNILVKNDIRTCLDIGAHNGNYAQLLADSLSCTVYAVEPSTTAYAKLSERARLADGKIVPIKSAVSDTDGEAVLYAKAPGVETATLDQSVLSHAPYEERVTVTTIDSFLASGTVPEIDFLKIDTEGFEREVLRGASATLESHPPRYIQLEFNHMQLKRGYTVYDLSLLLSAYDFYRLLPHGWLKIDPTRYASNIYRFSNIVAVRKA